MSQIFVKRWDVADISTSDIYSLVYMLEKALANFPFCISGCVKNNVLFLEAATYNSTTVDTCKVYCRTNLTCKYFTWNSQTQVHNTCTLQYIYCRYTKLVTPLELSERINSFILKKFILMNLDCNIFYVGQTSKNVSESLKYSLEIKSYSLNQNLLIGYLHLP